MSEYMLPGPVVRIEEVRELARDLVVIPNRRVQLVPNIGVIGGTHSVLVVETGMGPRNAETVLKFAAEYAAGRRLYLTTTHFHPEHAFGAQVFAGEATFLVNRAQAEDLVAKGAAYLDMFRGLGEPVARQLECVEIATPDVVYDDAYDLDLGGRVVRLRAATARRRPRLPRTAARRDLGAPGLGRERADDRRGGRGAHDRAAPGVGRPGMDREGRRLPVRPTPCLTPTAAPAGERVKGRIRRPAPPSGSGRGLRAWP
ncbi:MBL fold metallo-hydrolase [Microbispora siamensis]